MKRQKVTSIRDIGDLEFEDIEEELSPSQTPQLQTQQQPPQGPQPSPSAADSGVPPQPPREVPREVRPPSTYYETRTPQSPLPAPSSSSIDNIVNILDKIHPVERAAIIFKYAETDAAIRKLTINEVLDYLQRYNIPSDMLKVIKIWMEIKGHG